jgi:hypothetical protein
MLDLPEGHAPPSPHGSQHPACAEHASIALGDQRPCPASERPIDALHLLKRERQSGNHPGRIFPPKTRMAVDGDRDFIAIKSVEIDRLGVIGGTVRYNPVCCRSIVHRP